MRHALLLVVLSAAAAELPVVDNVEHQPFAAQAIRVSRALAANSAPLVGGDEKTLAMFTAGPGGAAQGAVQRLQQILDPHCLAAVRIDSSGRMEVLKGPSDASLSAGEWRPFLVKVINGPARPVRLTATASGRDVSLVMFDEQPLQPLLSGLEVEYRILRIRSAATGNRPAKITFQAGSAAAPLDVVFTVNPAPALSSRKH